MAKKIKAIEDLAFDDRNINKGSEFGTSLLHKSLSEVGAGRSVLADKNGVLIAGNKTVEAAAQVGISKIKVVETNGDELIVVQRTDLDINSPEGAKMKILDNTVSKHNYVEDAEVTEAICEEYEIEPAKYGLSAADVAHEAEEDDFEIPDEIKTDIVLGDLFEIGQHRLLCGDSTNADDVAKLMNGQKADMVFTDPPYGVNYTGGVIHGNKINTNHKRDKLQNDDVDIYGDFMALLPLIIDNGALYIFYATRNSYEVFKALKDNGVQVMAVLAWIKINTGYADMNSHYKNRYEPCVYCKVGERTHFVGATSENTTWEIEKDRDNKMHPTQKPISVPYRAIKNHTANIVADLFCGSGSTMVAAHQLNRKCYGMELDPKYCQVIVDRLRKLDPSIEIKRNGQPYKPS